MRQTREGVRTLAETEHCYIKLYTDLLWALLPYDVCESVHMCMYLLASRSVCELNICTIPHQGVSLKKELIKYLQSDRLQKTEHYVTMHLQDFSKVCNTFQGTEVMS